MNPTTRPDLTYAVLVGVDTYASPRLRPLHGPALDACWHARWLRSKGVPAAHIRLLVSPGEQARTEVAAVAGKLGLTPRPATQAEVERVLVDELPEWRGDLLWFAWSGHGILDDRDQQRLFCADARPAYEVNLPMGEFERNLLHDRRYEGIREKICVVDACRVFDVPASSLPGTLSLGRTESADSQGRLASAYATQDGRGAANLSAEGRGLFTSHLLAELERSRAWPPDLPTVLERAKARMSTAAVVQVPYLVERRHDGGSPVPFGSRVRLSPHIRTHAEELARLRGKGSYLVQKNLPFVSPRDGSDPKRLFGKLDKLNRSASEQEPKRGFLLIGPAGAGKTRTVFEIAKVALEQREPWQVLHVAGSPEVSTDDVMAAVREQVGRQRVLLIFDYLDSYEALNIKALGEALQTEDPDGRVACVASVRPGMLRTVRKSGVRILLDEVPLRIDRDHTEKVISQIFVKVAPGMLEKPKDARRLSQACGQRPIIALLIARELEARLKLGVSELDFLPPRPTDLLIWLQQRTEQDFGEPAKETQLLASAVAAASCEQDQDAVEEAVRRFLALWPDATFRNGPEGVVGRLLHLGWLVESGQGIDSVHDVVTDEFLRMAAVDPEDETLRAEVLKALLSAFLAGARTFGVASRHLRRWSADLVDTQRRTLERACANWLADNIGQLAALVAGEPQAGRSIMLTMLSGSPWRKAVDDNWDRLVGPWLEETEERDPGKAATALDSAVRNSVGGVSEHLVDACLAWVERQRTTREVSPLLRLLIETDGVSASDRDKVAAHTLGWLEEQRALSRAGARLLAALLRCKDLGADRAVEVIDLSLKRMEQSKRNPDAGLVLRPLLLRKDLDEPRQTRAVDRALAWLGAEPPPSAAALVLAAALRSEKLRDGQVARVTRSAYTWLKAHGGHIDAAFVLEPLLAQCREATEARVVLNHAFGWLGRHVPVRRSSYVLAEVLLRKGLGAKRAAAAIADAQIWLVENGLIDDAKFLLSSLLSRSDIDRETTRKLADDAVTWLSRHGLDNGGTYVVSALLRPDAVAGHVDEAARTALTLLGDTYNPAVTRSTLVDVLKSGAGAGPRRDAVDRALDWLDENELEFEATYVLGPLLEHRRFLEGRTSRAARLALAWLNDHGTRPEASFVLDPLLALPGVTSHEAGAIEEKAQAWLADHLPSEDARFLLSRLLRRPKLALNWPESVETLAFTWLGYHGDRPYASYVIDPLLRWSDAARPEDAVLLGLSWLKKNTTAEGVSSVVLTLAARRDLDLDQYAWCIDRLLELLDLGSEPACKLLNKEVWFRSDLDPVRAARLAEHMLGVLEDEEAEPPRGLLIGLLGLALRPEQQCRAVRVAFRWLEAPAASAKKVSRKFAVVVALLKRDDLRADQLAGALQTLESLAHWSQQTNHGKYLGWLLAPVLGNPRVDASYRADATRRALEWLGSYGTHRGASSVLAVLLDRLDLAPEDGETVAAYAEEWLAVADSESWGRLSVEDALRRYRERQAAAPVPPAP